jgi:hypothetical protein
MLISDIRVLCTGHRLAMFVGGKPMMARDDLLGESRDAASHFLESWCHLMALARTLSGRTRMTFLFKNSSMPSAPVSRPYPDFLVPPKGMSSNV